jgi:amino acid adenylation domain-containing protein/FkbH-like protein
MNEQVAESLDLTDSVSPTQNEPSDLQPTGSSTAKPNDTATFHVAVAATYTADPLIPLLGFWFRTLALSAEVVLAPYAQVMQQLLDPYSDLGRNKSGVNVLMVRLQDWIRDRATHPIEENLEHLRTAANELTAAINEFRGRTPASLLVCFCPSSAELSHTYQHAIESYEAQIAASLGSGPNVQCLSHVDVIELFPEVAVDDARADRIGHVPYTEEYFIAMATLLARRIAVSRKPPFKVIAVDADNTLWNGVCGEVNASGIELTETHLELQRMLVRQHDAGMLLCLCSKNNPADVQAVFRERDDMVLREQHVICWRVNWESKSSNLRSLAEELSLSLDSFIFIDDSAIECAEVRANAPGVLALQLPDTPEGVAHLLKHAWAFDRHGVTEDAKRRTEQYRQNQQRAEAMRSSGSLHQFLASLQLQVDIGAPRAEHLPRIAELTQRTNQFNLTTIRRSVSEIEALKEGGDLQMRVIHVKDRFGDYGLVGAVMFRQGESDLDVDTFVLSCRALGRGVELRIAAELGRCARKSGHSHVLFRFRRTARNAPAWTYLQSSFAQFELPRRSEAEAAEHLFRVPAQYAQDLLANSSASAAAPEAEQATQKTVSDVSHEWHESALRLSRLDDIVRAIVEASPRTQRSQRDHVAAESEMELALARIWADLLRLDQVGLRENFLELGGDSLLAVRVVARIGSELGLELPLHEFFANPTIEGTAAALGFASKAGHPIEPMDRTQPAPLSSSQRRLWFIDQLEGGSVAYHIPLVAQLQGNLNTEALSAALQELMQRHEVLRSVVDTVAGEPVQGVAADAQLHLRHSNLEDLALDLRQEMLDRIIRDEIATSFDLTRGPLIRATLLRLEVCSHVLVIVMHHLVSDGWSIGVFIRELSALYEAHLMRRPSALPQLPIQYGDYARWQTKALSGAVIERQLAYWKAHLSGAPELLELPTDRPRPIRQSHKGGSRRFNLEAPLTRDLAALCRRFNLTLPMALHTAWSVVLSRLSGQDDIVLGVPVANRRRAEVEGLIGFFVNTLAIRVRPAEELPLDALLLQVRSALLQGYAHQDVPFERVVEVLQPARSTSHSAIFQGMFVFQNAPREPMQLAGLTIAEVEPPNDTAKFDLTLTLQPSGEQLTGSLNYAVDLFEPDTVDRWVGHFQQVLREMVRDPGQRLAELRMMEGTEQRRVAEVFNQTQGVLEHELIHRLFERQVELASHAPAVIFGERSLSFAELNDKANQLAHYLRERGVGPDALVAVCFERGLEMMIAIFGVLKAGGAYVPLDASNPPERLAHVLDDARPKVLLTVSALVSGLPASAAEVVALDSDWSAISVHPTGNPDPRALGLTPRHLAYVIYTSGSTGKPKGVMIEHRNIANYSLHALRQFDIAGGGGSLLSTSIGFDLALTGLYPTLLAGRPVRICREEHGMPALVEEVHRCSNLSPLKLTPSHLKLLEQSLRDGRLEGRVQTLVLGGEPLPSTVVSLWKEHSPKTRVFNHYGPTETTVGCAVNEIVDLGVGVVPIGRPISNTQIYILDHRRRVVPIGVVGELYIGGAGVARGYLNRPELTAERFISDPFNSDSGARLYKTGDLGRWRADGVIEFLGRNDHQVKIRGFRIELGEIEAQLSKLGDVREAVVIAREDSSGEKRLVAYVVWQSEAEMSVEALRTHLKASLPEYMVPSAFVRLERMPLTPNGKLDRRALPAPELGAYASREYQPPQGELEEIVAGIWQTLLGVQQVGRLDNFFELGGHSLLIVQMMERLRRAGLSTEVRQVFDSATLSDLAQALRSDAGEQWGAPPNQIPEGCEAITPQMLPLVELEAEHIERIAQSVPGGMSNIQDIYPLAPLQEGILFHHLLSEGGGDPYVVPTLLSVSDRARVNELVAALQRVMGRHDVLRTSILWEQLPRAVQVVHRRVQLAVEEVTLDGQLDVSEQLKAWLEPGRQRLHLQRAPLMRLQIAADPHSPQWFVMFQLHHIIDDATSRRLLIEEVVACMEDRADQLPVAVSYREHVSRACARAELHDAALFFRRKLGDVTEPTAPFGILDVHGTGAATKEACEDLEPALARRLRAQARRLGVSAATLFHAAWALVVAHTSGRDDVVFGSVLLGRMQGSAETQRTLGMFINTLPLRVQLQSTGVKALIERTQRELVELLDHEQASLAMAQSCSGITSGAALFSALLNYRHSAGNLTVNWGNARGVQVIGRRAGTNYPVTLSVDDLGDGFRITIQTDQAIDAARITSYVEAALSGICEALETSPQCRALAVPVVGEQERQQLLESFNANAMPYPRDALIHELFEEQARRTPELPAVLHHDQSLTYQDLNRKANQLARHLRSLGVRRNEVVGICIERSLDMVVGLLGILKAGAGYLPLDPSHPPERLEHMLSDALPRVVLTQDALRERLPATQAIVVALDTVLAQLPGSGYDNLERAPAQTSEDLLYVIYTSGSTGRPKGTAMPHGSMTNLMQWHAATLPALGQRVLQFAALSFDVAFQETFSTLCTGGTLVMVDEWIRRDARALMELLNTCAVQRLFLPPLMLQSLAESSTAKMPALFLKDIITAGEQLRVSQEIVQFIKGLPGCRLHNHYGPTETHVVTALTLEGDPSAWPKLPSIGRPISNTRIYVLNSEGRPTPLGVAGEIYIGGANVARGYMNRAELTAERFIDDPFSASPGARMYRTGDLGRWRSDGSVEYLGRNDDQVKIRGFRIELGEVESHLAACAGVREAAVIAREDTPGERRLVAYVTVRERTQHGAEHLRAALKKVLPDYMIPSAFVTLDELPLTPTGKLNRRALPMPDAAAFDTGNYEAPRGEVERALADLWQQLLRVERVGRFDHFFELGGHSLHGMKVALHVEQRFGVHLSVVAVFQYPTVEELAQVIERLRTTPSAAAPAVNDDDDDAGDFEEGVLFAGIADAATPGDVVNGG